MSATIAHPLSTRHPSGNERPERRVAGDRRWPTGHATTVEDPEHFVPLPEHLRRRWGRPEAVRMAEVGFVNPHLASVRFQAEGYRSRGTDVAEQLRRYGDRWMVTRETMAAVLGRGGIDVATTAC